MWFLMFKVFYICPLITTCLALRSFSSCPSLKRLLPLHLRAVKSCWYKCGRHQSTFDRFTREYRQERTVWSNAIQWAVTLLLQFGQEQWKRLLIKSHPSFTAAVTRATLVLITINFPARPRPSVGSRVLRVKSLMLFDINRKTCDVTNVLWVTPSLQSSTVFHDFTVFSVFWIGCTA